MSAAREWGDAFETQYDVLDENGYITVSPIIENHPNLNNYTNVLIANVLKQHDIETRGEDRLDQR